MARGHRHERGCRFVSLGLVSQAAHAHGSVQGLGNFFSGVVHPLFEPAHLIALIALGPVLGQRGLKNTRPAALCFVAGSALGLLAVGLGWAPSTDPCLLAAAALVGLAVATAVALPRVFCALIAALVGLGIGLGSEPESVTGTARIVMLLGAGVGVCVWMFNVVGLVHELKRPWLQILVRVFGSWITASALLVMAWWISGKPLNSTLPAARSAAPPVVLDTAR